MIINNDYHEHRGQRTKKGEAKMHLILKLKIKKILRNKKISIKKLYRLSGPILSFARFNRIIKGEEQASSETLRVICNRLDCTKYDILG